MGAPLMVLGDRLKVRGARGWKRWVIGLSLGLSLGVVSAWTAPYWGATVPPETLRRALESSGVSGFWVYDRVGLLLRAIPERGDSQAHQMGQEIQESRGVGAIVFR